MRVITISGKAGHGKDTVATMMKEQLQDNLGLNVLIAHYADLVKHVCKTFFEWDGIKDQRGRSVLQYVGTDVVRAQDQNYWVDFIADMLTFFNDEWDVVLIPDCRFPNEIDRLRRRGFNVTSLIVRRPDFDNGLTDTQKSHPSETSIDYMDFDGEIINAGDMNQLRLTVNAWLDLLCNVRHRADGTTYAWG